LENIIALHEEPFMAKMLCSDRGLLQLIQNNKINIAELADKAIENAEACITGCEVLVARTGSIILSSSSIWAVVHPVFYPVHIVVAYASQIVNDIENAIELMKKRYGNNLLQ